MRTLVLVEHDGDGIRGSSLSAVGFARSVAQATDGDVTCLVLGTDISDLAGQVAMYGATLSADACGLAPATADACGKVIADVVRQHGFELLVAAATSDAKDVVGRAAGLLGGRMASDVVSHEVRDGDLLLRRPMYAGSVTATVKLLGSPKIVTVRASAYEPAVPSAAPPDPFEVASVSVNESSLPQRVEVKGRATKEGRRPDVTEANVVVSGGRAWKSAEDFENHVGRLADVLGGAAGSSRVLVDAGIAPNELQVGQTGKIVAPDLYLALGISGAVQHLAGMKNSKVIVSVNDDPDAPIFQVSDFGVVGDVYELVPRLIERLS